MTSIDNEQTFPHLLKTDQWLELCRHDLTQVELAQLRVFMKDTLPHVSSFMINEIYFKNLKHQFDKVYWKSLTKSKRTPVVKAIFAATTIREFIARDLKTNEDIFMHIQADFTQRFQDVFSSDLDAAEQCYLPRYFWAIQKTAQFVPGFYNKCMFLKIGTLIEGSGMSYTTGGAPSPSTKRRISIYEQICGVTTPKRVKAASTSSTKRGRDDDSDGDDEDDEESIVPIKAPVVRKAAAVKQPKSVKRAKTTKTVDVAVVPVFAEIELPSEWTRDNNYTAATSYTQRNPLINDAINVMSLDGVDAYLDSSDLNMDVFDDMEWNACEY